MSKRNIFLTFSLLSTAMLTGCNSNNTEELEVVDEFILAEDEDDKNNDNKNDKVEEKEEKEEDKLTKEEVEIKDDKVEEIEEDKSNNNSTDINEDKKEELVNSKNNNATENSSSSNNTEIKEDTSKEKLANAVFTKSDIPESVKSTMLGKSMPTEGALISFDELSYLRISHYDFNGNTQIGELIVNKAVASEVLEIFKDLYVNEFPIERMKLVDVYNANDEASMNANNTSAFNYRLIAGTNKLSNHAKGLSIDINPFLNPHVVRGVANPPSASKYINRNLNEKGMISKNSIVYKAFTSRGWKWGGNWNNPDYQHFEKQI